MRNISAFCLQRITLYFKGIPNSEDFDKGIFLHVIPVRIIIPCFSFTVVTICSFISLLKTSIYKNWKLKFYRLIFLKDDYLGHVLPVPNMIYSVNLYNWQIKRDCIMI